LSRKNTGKVYVQTLPEADIDSAHNLLFAKICIVLNKIIKFQNGKPRCDLEKLHAIRQEGQDALEENFSASNMKVGMWR
jgi:hypothetical protein